MDHLFVDSQLYQWDTGRRVIVSSAYGLTAKEVHFNNPLSQEALVVDVKTENGITTAAIPDELLQAAQPITAYSVMENSNGDQTVCECQFSVKPRLKPADYTYTKIEELTPADKAEIIEDVLAALPKWTGGSF